MRRQRRFVLITWIGIALALAGVAYPVLQAVSRPAAAQDGTNPVGTVAGSSGLSSLLAQHVSP